MPAPIDEIRRKIMQLEIEEQALKKEVDDASKEKLTGITAEKEELQKKESELKAKWESEKNAILASALLRRKWTKSTARWKQQSAAMTSTAFLS